MRAFMSRNSTEVSTGRSGSKSTCGQTRPTGPGGVSCGCYWSRYGARCSHSARGQPLFKTGGSARLLLESLPSAAPGSHLESQRLAGLLAAGRDLGLQRDEAQAALQQRRVLRRVDHLRRTAPFFLEQESGTRERKARLSSRCCGLLSKAGAVVEQESLPFPAVLLSERCTPAGKCSHLVGEVLDGVQLAEVVRHDLQHLPQPEVSRAIMMEGSPCLPHGLR